MVSAFVAPEKKIMLAAIHVPGVGIELAKYANNFQLYLAIQS
jgi:hypothetical protein